MTRKLQAPMIAISTCIDVGQKINPERTYQYLEISYAESVAEAGGIPCLIPYLKSGEYERFFKKVDGLLITGGEDLPTNVPDEKPQAPFTPAPECRIQQDTALLKAALHRRIPVLGICYGMQFINFYFGGTLYYDIPYQVPGTLSHRPGNMAPSHQIRIKEGSRLWSIIQEKNILANSGHHQAVRDVAAGLTVSATCEDGVVEAIEKSGEQFILGIQWHPEKYADSYRHKIFKALVDACKLASPAQSSI